MPGLAGATRLPTTTTGVPDGTRPGSPSTPNADAVDQRCCPRDTPRARMSTACAAATCWTATIPSTAANAASTSGSPVCRLNGSPDSPLINFIQFRIIKDRRGEISQCLGHRPGAHHRQNIAQLVRAGRARWKIENETFNTLKNQGYHLKHNFGHGDRHLSEAFFVLNLLAFFHAPDL